MIPSKTATRRALSATAFALTTIAASAHAQQSGAAEQLFVEGKALMRDERYPEACAKFKAAFELDRTATGTLLNLALCHEKIDKLASAWAEYRQAAADSVGRRQDRVALAREREAALLPRLARIRIVVSPNDRPPVIELSIDGHPIVAEASEGTELPIDAGAHTLRVAAPSRIPIETSFDAANAELRQLFVPTLEHAHVELRPPPAIAEPEVEDARRVRRVVGISLGAAGLVVAGVGLAVGAGAFSANRDANGLCPNQTCPSEALRDEATTARDSARASANVSNVLVAVGGALVVTGVVLVITALPGQGPRKSAGATSVGVGAGSIGPAAAGLWLEGPL